MSSFKKLELNCPIKYVNHHQSHAAAGYYTSSFQEAAVVVIDAVGEFQTITIWYAKNNKLDLKFEVNFPSSIGLLYSAFTKRCGLKPCDEEYVLMGMAAYGEPIYAENIWDEFIGKEPYLLKKPVHYGIGNWMPNAKTVDLAASIQMVCEQQVQHIINKAISITGCKQIAYTGGVALNCVCNSKIKGAELWIPPNPGDAGSSLGVVNQKLNWKSPYLGTNLGNDYPIDELYESLMRGEVVGVANGRAEFGPRALGNRSLLADPRSNLMKDKVNNIKLRQKFRPFAPVILEEHVKDWFDLPYPSPYMQFTAKCLHPEKVPAICHIDNTSRVQTVSKHNHAGLYDLLTKFYEKTGCPMLLNTSLNIRGQPIVNDMNDVNCFKNLHNIKVLV